MNFCQVQEDLVEDARGYRQWVRGFVPKWTIAEGVPGFDEEGLIDIYTQGYLLISAVCGIQFEYTDRVDRANIVWLSDRIDGPGGVLARHELPPPNADERVQIKGWIDVSERRWVNAVNPPQRAQDIARVQVHEAGHGVGLGHAPQGSRNLMAPTVSDIRTPQRSWDIPQLVARYGSPHDTAPVPQPGNGSRFDKEIFSVGFKNGKLRWFIGGQPV